MANSRIMPEMAPILEKSVISADDVILFRKTVFADGIVSRAEADSLFAVNDRLGETPAEWRDFFVEAMTDYVVRQADPQGYIDDDKARWLIERIDADGVVKTACELETLVKALEIARSSPDVLAAYALDQVRRTVLSGSGAYARGPKARPGIVTAGDVAMLRRVLYAFGGDGHVAITRAEAEVLFELNDATADAANDPAWGDLFVKATANYLMAHTLYRAPDRATAKRREEWLDSRADTGSLLKSMFGTLLSGDIAAVRDAFKGDSVQAERNAAVQADIAASQRITGDEVAWLTDRIGRDGVLHRNERALLDFIRSESPEVHPSLKKLLDKAERAA